MLAIKRVIAERDPVSTYVFDEVEQGVAARQPIESVKCWRM